MLTLPIHIGNVSLDKKRSSVRKEALPSNEEAAAPVSMPDAAPQPAPRPAPRFRMSTHSSPSAPPAENHPRAESGNMRNEDFTNKRQSQLVSPNAFSYAPGLLFPQNPQANQASAALSGTSYRESPEATGLYPSLIGANPMPSPPGYGISSYPQGTIHAHIFPYLKWSTQFLAGFHRLVQSL